MFLLKPKGDSFGILPISTTSEMLTGQINSRGQEQTSK
jgi:hypothetical protein